ncbi:MAG: hypothetical protein LBP79_05570 [Clostridiales bacterium]|jgi:hypothetical protein|nr:hypothetical protein [Clostridiales bacterium]
MGKGLKNRLSAVAVLVFATATAALAVAPNYVSGLPGILEGYKPFEYFLNFSDLNIDLFTGHWDLTAYALGIVLAAVTAALSVIAVFTGKELGIKTVSVISFLLILGYGVYQITMSGVIYQITLGDAVFKDLFGAVHNAYYIVLAGSFISGLYALCALKD